VRGATSTWSGLNPGSTSRIFWKLRRKAPDKLKSTKATAISETTRLERSQEWLSELVADETPSLRLSIKLVRKAAKAGATLQHAPLAKARRRAKTATVGSSEIELRRGMDSGKRRNAVRRTSAAHARPSTPPVKLSRRPSHTASCTIAPEPAPRARRTAYSRRRRMARTNSMAETFTQAISKTMATANNKVRSSDWTSRTMYSRNGVTSPLMRILDMLAGKSRMICRATRSASRAAWRKVTPSLRRATM